MKKMTWKTAAEYVANYNELTKIAFIIFTDPSCGICSELTNDICQFESDEFEVIIVDDGNALVFPMPQYPTCYVFIPGMKDFNGPLIKVGGAPKEILESDVKVQLESFRTKKHYYKVIEEWAQKKQ